MTFSTHKNVIGKGSKWTLQKLFAYLSSEKEKNMAVNVEKIWKRICEIAILTFLPIVMEVKGSSNCFELFGFDVLIDGNSKCWLLEVNGSPAIGINGEVDEIVKNVSRSLFFFLFCRTSIFFYSLFCTI